MNYKFLKTLHMDKLKKIGQILNRAKKAAIEYKQETGKPLGITGEYGEYIAAKLLNLTLAEAREPGFDAKNSKGKRIQIKTRVILQGKRIGGQRTPKFNLKHKWDSALLVLLSENYHPIYIYEASRTKIRKALTKPGSKSRNERGALSVSQFISAAEQVWTQSK